MMKSSFVEAVKNVIPDEPEKANMKIIIKTYRGWAINARSKEGHKLIGSHWWFGDAPSTIPLHLQGHIVTLFRTRKEARENLDWVRERFPKAKVEHVTVDVSI